MSCESVPIELRADRASRIDQAENESIEQKIDGRIASIVCPPCH